MAPISRAMRPWPVWRAAWEGLGQALSFDQVTRRVISTWAAATFVFEGGAAPMALDLHFEIVAW